MTPLDELGLAITNAGYTWTPEMRKAYEKGSRKKKKEWVELTDEEIYEEIRKEYAYEYSRVFLVCLRIQERLKEKNT